MHHELTNLLPTERIRAIRREYFLRLATVFIYALSAITIGSGALLIPSYLYVHGEVAAQQARINELDTRLAASKGQETNARVTALTENATYLARLGSTSSATAVLRATLAVPRTGITLTGFTYTPATHGPDGKMTLRGVASTRETLRAYDQALGQLPFVTNNDLPISSYAKESSIPFTITLTGTLLP
ncbi:MAG: hypothetical protein JWL82_101 [Parcubacteria group bacterium]|nr:hypothetical protein [Parcubacteria group bacterium]